MFSDYLELYTDGVCLRDITHVLRDFLARALNTSQVSLVTTELLVEQPSRQPGPPRSCQG